MAAVAAALCHAVGYVDMDRFLVSRQPPITLAAGQLLAASTLTLLALPVVHGWTVPAWRLDALLAPLALGILSTASRTC